MFSELNKLWKESDFIQKLLIIGLLPISISIGIVYGLFLIFWNRYALAIGCALLLMELGDVDNEVEAIQTGQSLAFLIGIIFLIIRFYKKSKK